MRLQKMDLKKYNKFFLVILFSILLIFPVFVNGKEECIFDNLRVLGEKIHLDCEDKLIEAKELFDVNITLFKSDVKIWSDAKLPICPFYEVVPQIAHFNETLYIRSPKMCDWHYFAVQVGINVPDYFRIKFMAADEYNQKYKKTKTSIDSQSTKKGSSQITNVINNPQGPVIINNMVSNNNQGTQNINQSSKIENKNIIINFVIEHIIGISQTIISITILTVIFNFFRRKKKAKFNKSKTKKSKS